MKAVALIFSLLLIASIASAQIYPPSGLNANHDGDGTVTLSWSAPPIAGISGPRDLVDWPETDHERRNWNLDWDAIQKEWEDLQASRDELDDFVFYFLYRNGEQIEMVWDTEFVDVLPQTGTYAYAVSAFYDDGESELTSESVVTWYDQVNFVINEDFNDGVLPDGWIVEANIASYTWHVDDAPFQYQTDFPTPLCWVDSDGAGNGPHFQERLIMPNFDFSETSLVELTFDYFFMEYIQEHLYVEYRLNGGPWNTFVDYTEEGTYFDVVLDMTGPLAGQQDADICFFYDDLDNWGFYAGVDDVLLQRDQVNPDPVVLDLIGMETNIGESGGVVGYDIHFISQLPNTIQNVKYWATVTTPSGVESEPVAFTRFTHTPLMDVLYRFLQLYVPADAIPGEYTFNGYVGLSINNPLIGDTFTFVKQGEANTAGDYVVDPSEWISYGLAEQFGETSTVEVPSAFALDAAYPNPFNAMTTLTLHLPESSPVTVAVYNTLGQQVTTLADGHLNAGMHSLVFDASGLASGLYFVRAEVPGQFSEMQKVVMMK